MPSVSGSNPVPLYFELLPEEFVTGRTIYDDNGADFKLQHGGIGVKRWRLDYDGLTAAQAAILDAHLAAAFYSPDEGSAFGFNFRDRDTAVLYSNVHYEKYEKSHMKTWIQKRSVTLVKRP